MKNRLKKIYEIFANFLAYVLYQGLKYTPVQYYQPLYRADRPHTTRACQDRWDRIVACLPTTPGSVLDIGCNLGYFTFKAAEKNKMVLGVDADPFYLLTCRAIKRTHNIADVFFLKSWISRDFLAKMPSFDIILNLSVFHHWVKEYGQDTAIEMMKILSSKTNMLIFETGQPDEKGTKWAEKLAFMGGQPDVWIKNFLHECGFTSVEVIGTFDTGLTATKRFLFCAKK